jgi:23S rRNA (adenine2503-C2)-methyltransferase
LGYQGDLSTGQIVEQVYWAGIVARQRGRSLRNVVFMGMGEPLHNLAAVLPAIDYLTRPSGAGLSPRHITLSTAGVPHAMLEVGRRFPRLRIALSLHSADAAQRRQLVPRAVGDLELLKQTLVELNAIQQQAVWIEMVLFDQMNDTHEHARLLANFCRGLQVEINLIPYNSAAQPTRYIPSPQWRREAFAQVLREAGLRTTIRTSLGAEVGAACGQLTATP